MTLEELLEKKVTITLNKTFKLHDDLDIEVIEWLLEDQKDLGWSDEEILKKVIEYYYDSHSDLDDILEFDDYKITIHD